MGVSKCSQYCEMGISEKIGAGQGPASGQFIWADSVSVLPPVGGDGSWTPNEPLPNQEMSALTYNPPPPPEYGKDAETLLGTPMPAKPYLSSSSGHGGTPPTRWRSPHSQSSRNGGRGGVPNYARPGEPVNKVYAQFSNDLEGFLPYTLVISEAQGLEFTSLCSSPDFTLDPLNIMKVSRVDFDSLMKDAFFTSISRSIHQRIIADGGAVALGRSSWPPHALEERCRPPYRAIVHLSVRRTLLDGCQVLVFIAVQSDPLAEELVQSCHKLKKRRAMRVSNDDPARIELSSRSISRGCITPRTAVCNAARATPPRTPPQATREVLSTPPQAVPREYVRPSPIASVAVVRA